MSLALALALGSAISPNTLSHRRGEHRFCAVCGVKNFYDDEDREAATAMLSHLSHK